MGGTVTLRFLGRETGGGGCPALFETDHGTFVIQGWGVTDPAVLAALGEVPSHETVIEVPKRLMRHLPEGTQMKAPTDDDWDDLFASVRHSACHVEMRDTYAVGEEADAFAAFLAGRPFDQAQNARVWGRWRELVRRETARGVKFRRVRIVSEPVTAYTRFLYATATEPNIGAGEQIRWLPRRLASQIALPGNDFWLLDDERVIFNLFTGDGDWAGQETAEALHVVELCRSAFEAVWSAAIPHEDYSIT
jgi:hypothetical protein